MCCIHIEIVLVLVELSVPASANALRWWLLLRPTPLPWIGNRSPTHISELRGNFLFKDWSLSFVYFLFCVLFVLTSTAWSERTHAPYHLAAHIPAGLYGTRRYSTSPATLCSNHLELEDASQPGTTTIYDARAGIVLGNGGDACEGLQIRHVVATTDLDLSRNRGTLHCRRKAARVESKQVSYK